MLQDCKLKLEVSEENQWVKNYIILRKEDNIEIGWCKLKIITKEEAGITYSINEEYRRQGYGTEAVKLMMMDITKNINPKRILAKVDERNIGAWRVIEKVGFNNTGVSWDEEEKAILRKYVFINYNIRKAEMKDVKTLGAIHANTWKICYSNIVPKEVLDSITPEKRECYFKRSIKENIGQTYIIENNNILGLITIDRNRDKDLPYNCGEIWGIYIHPDHWGKGAGTRLLSWAVKNLMEKGYEDVCLWVLEDNLKARTFYENMGFKWDGSEKSITLGKELKEIRYRLKV